MDHLEIPADPSRPIAAGLFVIIIAIGGFVTWAVLAPLASAVIASGVVKVDSNRKQIQHFEGGIVKEILVKNGDRVHSGDVLVRLDETKAAASLAILRDGIVSAIAQRSRLLAERDQKEAVIFPDSLNSWDNEQRVKDAKTTQLTLFNARRASLNGQIEILKKQIIHLREDIVGLNSQKRAKSRQLFLVKDELESLKTLLKKKLIGKQKVLELERVAASLEGENGEHISEIAATKTAIAQKELEIYQLQTNMQEKVISELRQVQAEIYDYEERINAADHIVKQTLIRSPVDGVVVGSGVHTVGGVVGPGKILLEIVPDNDRLIIEAQVNPNDIDNVQTGLPASVKITAFNQRRTPELKGKVIYVSADIFQDSDNGMSYFISRVEVSDTEIQRLGNENRLQPGMMANVFIKTGERTPADYLLQPLRDSFRRAWLEEN
jgi:membrane fusion protein, type I secretion system